MLGSTRSFWQRVPLWGKAAGGLMVLVMLILLILSLLRGCMPASPEPPVPTAESPVSPLQRPESPKSLTLESRESSTQTSASGDELVTPEVTPTLPPTATPIPIAVADAWVATGPVAASVQVNQLALAATDAAVVYAATDRGVFYSNDGGEQWVARNFGMGHYGELFISALALAPDDAQTLVIGTWGYGLLRSTDGGMRWTRLTDPLALLPASTLDRQARLPLTAGGPSYFTPAADAETERQRTVVHCVALHPSNNAEIVTCLGDGRGLYRSTDGGSSWRPVNVGTGSARQFVFALADPQLQYATFSAGDKSAGLYRSTDGGTRWEEIGAATLNHPVMALAVHPTDAAMLLAGTDGGGLYRSADGGDTWTLVSEALDETVFYAVTLGEDVAYAGGEKAFYTSTDGGATWRVAENNVAGPVQALAVAPEGAVFVGAGRFPTGGVYKRATPDAPFTLKIAGMQDVVVVDMVLVEDALYLATWGTGVFRSTDSGTTWEPVDLPAPYIAALTVIAGTETPTLWVATAYSDWGFFRSDDDGDSWRETGTGSLAAAAFDIASVDDDPAHLVATTFAGAYYSGDGGETWQPTTGLVMPTLRVCRFPNSTQLLAATYGGGIFYSSDGRSWYAANVGIAAETDARYIYDLSCASGRAGVAYAAGTDIYRTQDYGAHWDAMGAGLSDDYFQVVAAAPDGHYVLAGSSRSGIFLSTSTRTWSALNVDLDELRVCALTAVADWRVRAFAGTNGRGVWSYVMKEAPAPPAAVVYLPLVARGTSGPEGESYEANNTIRRARAIAMPGQLASYIETDADEDFFRFDVRDLSLFTVNLTHLPEGLDYDLELYNSKYVFVAGSYWPAGYEETISFQPTVAGRYYARVYSSGGSNSAATYQLTLAQAVTEMAGQLYGTVTENGRPLAGVPIVLYYDNGYRVTRINTLTERDGTYHFRNLPALPAGHTYSVVYPNYEGDPERLAYWICRSPEGYQAGAEVEVCSFDVAAVAIAAPAHASVVKPAVIFAWEVRDVAGDEYQLRLYSRDEQTVWHSDPLEDGTYTLAEVPASAGFENAVDYQWDVVISTETGYGISHYYRQITFSTRAQESKSNEPGAVQYPDGGIKSLPPLPDAVLMP